MKTKSHRRGFREFAAILSAAVLSFGVQAVTPLSSEPLTGEDQPEPRQNDATCNPTHVLCTPSAVRQAFEATGVVTRRKGNLKIPAVVSNKLLVRAFALSSSNKDNGDPDYVKSHYTLNRPGQGRWFTFVGGADLLEKVLVAGQYAATKVYRNIGYGAQFTCGPDQFYWLAVFEKRQYNSLRKGIYDNLSPWLGHVYRQQAPAVDQTALYELKTKRFTEITGCPVDPKTGVFNYKEDLMKCKPCFQDSYNALSNKACGTPDALTYSPSASCPTDQALFSFGPNPSACQLRAYLYSAATFNEFNTGYGYTANDYNDPLSHEYWMDNVKLSDLPNLELLKVNCGKGPLDAKTAGATATGMVPNNPYVTEF